jgi:hypothetical protein
VGVAAAEGVRGPRRGWARSSAATAKAAGRSRSARAEVCRLIHASPEAPRRGVVAELGEGEAPDVNFTLAGGLLATHRSLRRPREHGGAMFTPRRPWIGCLSRSNQTRPWIMIDSG